MLTINFLALYTVVGYLDLFEIHPIFEHMEARNADAAVEKLKTKLKRASAEYRKVLDAENREPLTVIAVFNGHRKDSRRAL